MMAKCLASQTAGPESAHNRGCQSPAHKIRWESAVGVPFKYWQLALHKYYHDFPCGFLRAITSSNASSFLVGALANN
jgi:hypothetical protein